MDVNKTDRFIKVAHPVIGVEELEAVTAVLLSGNYVSGKKVEEFEKAFLTRPNVLPEKVKKVGDNMGYQAKIELKILRTQEWKKKNIIIILHTQGC